MVVSAQFRLGGFYAWVTRRTRQPRRAAPAVLLAAVVVACGGALGGARQRHRLPRGGAAARRGLRAPPARPGARSCSRLACAANVGSAATLIGNPQNMLIGQTLQLSFAGYLADAARAGAPRPRRRLGGRSRLRARPLGETPRSAPAPPIADAAPVDRWQTAKGLAVVAPARARVPVRAGAARGARPGARRRVLLTSRRMASRDILGLVDWHLLVLFVGLFVVNHALAAAGLAGARRPRRCARARRRPRRPALALPGRPSCSRTWSPTCRP